MLATVGGVLLPLQRTLGLFLLVGVGVALLLDTWLHLVAPSGARPLGAAAPAAEWPEWCAVTGLALVVVAAPSCYHPSRGWGQL